MLNEADVKLYIALERGSFEEAKNALALGADVYSDDVFGVENALHYFISKKLKNADQLSTWLPLLIEHGVDVNAKGEEGQTAAHYLFERYRNYYTYEEAMKRDGQRVLEDFRDAVKVLKAHGADINIQDSKGFTPLNRICACGPAYTFLNLISEAIYAGANPFIKSAWGKDVRETMEEGTRKDKVDRTLKAPLQAMTRKDAIFSLVKGMRQSGNPFSTLPKELVGVIASYTSHKDFPEKSAEKTHSISKPRG